MPGRDAKRGMGAEPPSDLDRVLAAEPDYVLAAWKLPLIVSAIAVSIVGGFYLGGPGLGMAVGALAATSVLIMAIRHPPRPAIVPAAAPDDRTHLLLVLDDPLEEDVATAAVLAGSAGEGGDVLVLAPLRQRFLDRWACDTRPARRQAQSRQVVALAVLARAGVAARARLGDEDPVQAVEDALGSYPAAQVILVARPGARGDEAADQLRARLAVPFLRLGDPLAAPKAAARGATGRRANTV